MQKTTQRSAPVLGRSNVKAQSGPWKSWSHQENASLPRARTGALRFKAAIKFAISDKRDPAACAIIYVI